MCLFEPERRSDGQNSLKPLTDVQNSWLSMPQQSAGISHLSPVQDVKYIIKLYTQFTNRDHES